MEVREAAQRIFRVRGLVVLAFLVAGLASGYAVHRGFEPTTYTSSARLVMNGSIPQTADWAAALAGTVEGIVTSPDRITSALNDASATRDIVKFTRGVSTQPLSDSGVLELSVTDTDPSVATSVANTLAAGAVATLNAEQQRPTQLYLEQLQGQINPLASTIDGIDSRLSGGGLTATEVSALLVQRTDLSQQLTALITKQADVEQQLAESVGAIEIAPAVRPSRSDPSRLPLDLTLGALGGLIVGIALAALLETMQPTLASHEGIERALGAPVLGVLGQGGSGRSTILALNARLRRVANRAKTSTVVLWNGGEDLSDVALQLQAAGRLPLGVYAATSHDAFQPRRGLVVVLSPRPRLQRIAEAVEVCTGEGMLVLGAIIRTGSTRSLWRRRRRSESPNSFTGHDRLQVEEAADQASAALVS